MRDANALSELHKLCFQNRGVRPGCPEKLSWSESLPTYHNVVPLMEMYTVKQNNVTDIIITLIKYNTNHKLSILLCLKLSKVLFGRFSI